MSMTKCHHAPNESAVTAGAYLFPGLRQVSPSFSVIRLQVKGLSVGCDAIANVAHAGVAQSQHIPSLHILGLIFDCLHMMLRN